jgi:putative oxidoreductase
MGSDAQLMRLLSTRGGRSNGKLDVEGGLQVMNSLADALAAIADRHRDSLLLVARLALAFIFIESALNHSRNLSGFAATFHNFQLPEELGVPMAFVAVLVELLGGVALILGFRVRETAILMIAFLLVTIFIGHRFWEMEGADRRLHVIHIKKNVAIIGGFIALFVAGGGRFALSRNLSRR